MYRGQESSWWAQVASFELTDKGNNRVNRFQTNVPLVEARTAGATHSLVNPICELWTDIRRLNYIRSPLRIDLRLCSKATRCCTRGWSDWRGLLKRSNRANSSSAVNLSSAPRNRLGTVVDKTRFLRNRRAGAVTKAIRVKAWQSLSLLLGLGSTTLADETDGISVGGFGVVALPKENCLSNTIRTAAGIERVTSNIKCINDAVGFEP